MNATKKTPLTTDDLERTLADDRHLGFGYACTLDIASSSKRVSLDRAIVAVANELGLDYEQLFDWSNSKYGRWLADAVVGRGAKPNRETVRYFLNEDALAVLAEGA